MQSVYKTKALICVLAGLTVLSGCTRKAENSTVKFSLPTHKKTFAKAGASAQSTVSGGVGHVIINLTQGGVNIACSWDRRHNRATGPCRMNYPEVRIDNVPNGDGRLLQVLIAFEDEQSGQMSFSYADTTINMKGGEMPVNLVLEDVSGTGGGGHIWGRYISSTSPEAGPTGPLEVRAKPKDGRPSMTLMRGEAFNGYFQGFALEFLPLEYRIGDLLLFGKSMKRSDFEALAEAPGDDVYVEGFNDGFEIRGFFKGSAAVTLSGKNANDCSSGTPYEDCFDFDTMWGGPFSALMGPPLSNDGTNYSWEFLPGMTSLITGVKVIKVSGLDDFKKSRLVLDENLVDCAYAASIGDELEDVPAVLGVNSTTTGPVDPGMDPDTEIVLVCPYNSAGKMYNAALSDPEMNPGGGGGPSLPYVRFESNIGGNILVKNLCTYVRFGVYEFDGIMANSVPVVGDVEINIPSNSPMYNRMYSGADPTCSGSKINSFTVVDATEEVFAYMMVPVADFALAKDVAFTVASPDYEFGHQSGEIIRVGDRKLKWWGAPASAVPNVCYQLNFHRLGPDGNMWSGMMEDFTVSSTLNRLYNSSSECITDAGNAGQASKIKSISGGPGDVWVKTPASGSISISVARAGYMSETIAISTVAGPVAPTRLLVEAVSAPVEAGKCEEFRVSVLNANGTKIPAPDYINPVIRMPGSNIELFSSWDCMSPLSSLTIYPGNVSANFFARTLELGTFGLVAEAPGGLSNAQAIPYAVTFVTPPPASEEPWLTAQVPPIGVAVVGDFEFPKDITFAVSNLTSVRCEDMGGAPCPSSVWSSASRRLTISAADALADNPYRIFISKNGWEIVHEFSRSSFYPNLLVHECETDALSLGDVTSALSTYPGRTICIRGAAATSILTTIVVPQGIFKFIGKLAADGKSSTVNYKSGTTSIFQVDASSGGSSVLFANMNLEIWDEGSGARAAIKVNSADPGLSLVTRNMKFKVSTNDDIMSAVEMNSDQGFYDSKLDTFEVQTSTIGGASAYGVNSVDGMTTYMVGAHIFLNSLPAGPPAIGVKLVATMGTGYFDFVGGSIGGAVPGLAGDGLAFFSTSSSAHYVDIGVDSSRIHLDAAVGGPSDRRVFQGEGNYQLRLERSRVTTNLNNPPFRFGDTNSTDDQRKFWLRESSFVQSRPYPIFDFAGVSASKGMEARFWSNSFARAGTGSTNLMTSGMAAGDLALIRDIGGSLNAGNRYCASPTGGGWSAVIFSPNSLDLSGDPLSTNLPSPLPVGVDPNTGVCSVPAPYLPPL